MASMSAVRQASANLSLTLQESTRQVMNDVQQSVAQLDRKKEAVSQAGIERIQESNKTAAHLTEVRGKIDTYA